MAKKVEGNTGIRNDAIFCFNCGMSYKINYPQPINMVTAMMSQFNKDHKACKPTWTEPTNATIEKSELENAVWWAENGEHGMSSKAMFNCLSKNLNICKFGNYENTPSDPDDFGRCYKLLKAVPQWRLRLIELSVLSTGWKNLVENWDVLEKMYEQNVKYDWKNYKQIGMYEFMEKLLNNN